MSIDPRLRSASWQFVEASTSLHLMSSLRETGGSTPQFDLRSRPKPIGASSSQIILWIVGSYTEMN